MYVCSSRMQVYLPEKKDDQRQDQNSDQDADDDDPNWDSPWSLLGHLDCHLLNAHKRT